MKNSRKTYGSISKNYFFLFFMNTLTIILYIYRFTCDQISTNYLNNNDDNLKVKWLIKCFYFLKN